jgi:hypothetical protein
MREPPVKVRKQTMHHVEYFYDPYSQRRAVRLPGERLGCAQPALRLDAANRFGDFEHGDQQHDASSFKGNDFGDLGCARGATDTQNLRTTDAQLSCMLASDEYSNAVQPVWASQNKGLILLTIPIHNPETASVGMFARAELQPTKAVSGL